MRRTTLIAVGFGLLALLVLTVSTRQEDTRTIGVPLITANGREIGVVTLQPVPRNHVLVTVNVWSLTPGFHGFHVHEIGRCEVTDEGPFLTAGGHYDAEPEHTHGDHAGDLPVLLADANGRAYLSFHTNRFQLRELLDGDGSALIVHAGSDNYANIPRRYGGPDEITLANGDGGTRVACGVITR